MSVRGIENQMQITRAAELAKEASSQLKRTELMQDYQAVQARALAAQEAQKVANTLETQEVVFDKDKEGGGGSDEQKQQRQKQQQPLSEEAELPVSSGEHTIDIRI